MPSGRLQQQFIRLWQCCGEGQSQETTLNELAGASTAPGVICARL